MELLYSWESLTLHDGGLLHTENLLDLIGLNFPLLAQHRLKNVQETAEIRRARKDEERIGQDMDGRLGQEMGRPRQNVL